MIMKYRESVSLCVVCPHGYSHLRQQSHPPHTNHTIFSVLFSSSLWWTVNDCSEVSAANVRRRSIVLAE